MPKTITTQSSYQDPNTPPAASDVSKIRDIGLRKLLWKMFFYVRTVRQLETKLCDIEHLPPSAGKMISEGIKDLSLSYGERRPEVRNLFRGRLAPRYSFYRSSVWALREWVSLFGEVSPAQATSEQKIYGMHPKDAALEILLFVHERLPHIESIKDKYPEDGRRGGQRRVGIGRVSVCAR